jgi:hypothetical protein
LVLKDERARFGGTAMGRVIGAAMVDIAVGDGAVAVDSVW